MQKRKRTKILALDGGGAKGVFSLGVLKSLESEVKKPLGEVFDIVYGTSTGAIIATYICLGFNIDYIFNKYMELIPNVFNHTTPRNRNIALRRYADKEFGEYTFSDFKPLIGIVATDCDSRRPKIFKNSASQSFSRKGGFEAGFGASVSDALMASTAAIPILTPVQVWTNNQGKPELVDGGFVANNPSIFALTDAIGALKVKEESISLLSVGTGEFAAPFRIGDWIKRGAFGLFVPIRQLLAALDANANSTAFLVQSLFPKIKYVRVNESNNSIKCDLLTTNRNTLENVFVFGSDSYGKREKDILSIL